MFAETIKAAIAKRHRMARFDSRGIKVGNLSAISSRVRAGDGCRS